MEAGYRGSQMLARVRCINEQGAAFSEPIWKGLTEPTRTRIEETSRADWLPLAIDVELSRVLFELHGERGARLVSLNATLLGLNGPLLGAFASGAMRLFGINPSRFFSLVPKGWGQVYRNCGQVEVQKPPSGESVLLQYRELPSGFFEPGYLEGVAGGLEALFAFMEIDGDVDITEKNAARGAATITARWRLHSAEQPR